MLIVGAKGFAKEVLESILQVDAQTNLVLFDDISEDIGDQLFGRFRILRSDKEAKYYLQYSDRRFTIGIGNPYLRRKMYEKFVNLGGCLTSTISESAIIGRFNVVIEDGSNIMTSVILTSDIKVGRGTIINQLSSIGHDVEIGKFVEVCPNVSISGNCTIGDNTFIGTGAIILPKITIGRDVVVGAGAVVSKDLPDNCVAVGVPAKIIKQN